MKVKTINPHVYADIPRTIGEEYDMEDKFYPPMSAMGHVVRVDEAPITTRDLEAEPPKQYRRRDLRAK